jgi:signal transduction histidine kinase
MLAEEELLARPDGSRVPVLVSTAPVRGRWGEVIGAVVTFEDITPLKELERHREEWTSVIAHDLRQPVTVIHARADLLQRRLQRQVSPEELSKHLEHIRTAARSLNTMIGDLLDVSRIEARRLSLELQTVDLPALVQQVMDRAADATQGHPVEVQVDGDIPLIEVDPGRVEQILGNLLSNAAKYSDRGTEILVKVERRDGVIQVAVTNRGKGIPSEEIPRLFTRFHRTEWANEERITGLGLGLYISKGLVEAHGGQIWAESIPGQTTTFSFTLPIVRASA